MPVRILTMVDLPAPFSPISAVTSPARSVRCALCRARTPGKRLETPVSARRGAGLALAVGRSTGRGGTPEAEAIQRERSSGDETSNVARARRYDFAFSTKWGRWPREARSDGV